MQGASTEGKHTIQRKRHDADTNVVAQAEARRRQVEAGCP
jgi:hypothetical protein